MAILKDLIVHGSSRFLNKIYANEIQADEGIFSKLVAKNADITDLTVYGLLDSRGQLHTKTWTNSNIATIDGSFYITPTLNSVSGTFSFLNSTSTNARFIGDFSVMNSSSMYLGGKSPTTSNWTADSKVLITGQVKVNNEWIPLGNVVADISSVSSTTLDIKNIRTTINGNTAPSTTSMIYFVKPNQTLSYRNLKISLCEIFRNRASNPLGIYITSSGLNGKTFLDIYGGVEATSTAGNSGGLAKPNVRIGNLSGIPSFTTSGGDTVSPSGWGIFTTNGYFEGAIISDVGNIGGWNLTADSIWKGNSNFGNASGMYFGASGISLGSTFKVTNGGVLTTTSGTISGFQIDGTSIRTNGVAVTSNADNSISLSSTDFTRTINSVSRSGLRFAMGDKFGVTGDGTIYASNVDLTGKITATSGSISGGIITTGINASNISTGTLSAARIAGGSLEIGKLDTDAQNTITNAANTALSYITQIDANGIWVTPSGKKPSNTSTGAGATGARINADGMEIFKGGVSVASYGSSIRIGNTSSLHLQIDSSGIKFLDGSNVGVTYSSTGINFADNKQFYIGSNDSYILYTPAVPAASEEENGTPAILTIGGDIKLGETKSLQDLLRDVQETSTASIDLGNRINDYQIDNNSRVEDLEKNFNTYSSDTTAQMDGLRDSFDEYKGQTNTALTGLENNLNTISTDKETKITSLQNENKALQVQLESISSQIQGNIAFTNASDLKNVTDWISVKHIDGVPTLVLGSVNSPIYATFTNLGLEFRNGENSRPIAYIGADDNTENEEKTGKLYVTNSIVLQDLQFGDWAWYERANGNMSIKWKGADV